jgi:hypothetical protein
MVSEMRRADKSGAAELSGTGPEIREATHGAASSLLNFAPRIHNAVKSVRAPLAVVAVRSDARSRSIATLDV